MPTSSCFQGERFYLWPPKDDKFKKSVRRYIESQGGVVLSEYAESKVVLLVTNNNTRDEIVKQLRVMADVERANERQDSRPTVKGHLSKRTTLVNKLWYSDTYESGTMAPLDDPKYRVLTRSELHPTDTGGSQKRSSSEEEDDDGNPSKLAKVERDGASVSVPEEPSQDDLWWCECLLADMDRTLPDTDSIRQQYDQHRTNPNIVAIVVLNVLNQYKGYLPGDQSQFQQRNYLKALRKLAKAQFKVMNKEDAASIGLAAKGTIVERLERLGRDGNLEELELVKQNEEIKIIALFMKVHGIGSATARKFYDYGCRSLEDLKKVSLDFSQRIGLEHFDDFNTRIPRDKVWAHFEVIKAELERMDPTIEPHCMGSYRRGKKSCGDIDVMILKPHCEDPWVLSDILETLTSNLTATGFLKCQLTGLHNQPDKESNRWLGCSALDHDGEERGIWRRIDIFVVPWSKRGAAMLHCTGNKFMNIKMSVAALKKGWKLTEHGLYEDTRSREERWNPYHKHNLERERLIEAESERKIFDKLGMEYVEPHDRNI